MILPLQIYREFLHTATAKLRQEYIEAQAPWREAPHRPISGIPPYSTPSSTSFLSIPPFESPGPKTSVLSLSLIIIQQTRGSKQTQPRLQAREPSKDSHLKLPSALAGPPPFYNHFLPTSSLFALLRSDHIAVTGFLLSQVVALLLVSDSSRSTPSSCSLSVFSFFHNTERILQRRTPGKASASHSQLMSAS